MFDLFHGCCREARAHSNEDLPGSSKAFHRPAVPRQFRATHALACPGAWDEWSVRLFASLAAPRRDDPVTNGTGWYDRELVLCRDAVDPLDEEGGQASEEQGDE